MGPAHIVQLTGEGPGNMVHYFVYVAIYPGSLLEVPSLLYHLHTILFISPIHSSKVTFLNYY